MRCPRCNIEVSDSFDTCAVCKTPLVPSEEVSGSTLADRLASQEAPQRARQPTGPAPQVRRTGQRAVHRTGPMPPVPVEALDDEAQWPSERRSVLTTGPEWPTSRPDASARAMSVSQRPAASPPPDATNVSSPPEAAAQSVDPAAQAAIATRILSIDPEVERGTRLVDVSLPPVVKRAVRQRKKERKKEDAFDPDNPLDEVLNTIRLFYIGMHRFDRWTVWALVFSLVAAFLPWTFVEGIGLVSGIEGSGAASAAAALLALGCIHRRTSRRRFSGVYLLLQFIAAAGICAAPVYAVVIDAEAKMAYGMIATMLGGVLSVMLTLARLVRITA